MSDNLTMIKHRADEVAAVYDHLLGKVTFKEIAAKLTEVTFASVHAQFEGGRLASAVLETGVRAENGFRAVADSIVHVAGQPQAEGT